MKEGRSRGVSGTSDPAAASGAPATGLFGEFLFFLRNNRSWWLTPIVVVVLLLAVLVVFGGSGEAPFIYELF
jgi:Family of unknown function (DUF5989)